MSKANDLTGRTFGLLKVIRRVEDVKPGRPMWLCECRCGRSVVKPSTSLTKQNGVKSCGCLRHQKSPELIDLTDMTFGALRVLYSGYLYAYHRGYPQKFGAKHECKNQTFRIRKTGMHRASVHSSFILCHIEFRKCVKNVSDWEFNTFLRQRGYAGRASGGGAFRRLPRGGRH